MGVVRMPAHPCHLRTLPATHDAAVVQHAIKQNPTNAPSTAALVVLRALLPHPKRIALMIDKRWPSTGVTLTVGFPYDRTTASFRKRLLTHFNAWGGAKGGNVQFVYSARPAQIRVNLHEGGYAAYMGTDNSLIPRNEPTMWLEGFSDRTPESEFRRVARHEPGHVLGFPHEHSRKAIVDRLNPAAVQARMQVEQGWSEADINEQVLTPLEEIDLIGTVPEETSVMCYWFEADLTVDGQPILGGTDITARDREFAARVYPKKGPRR